MKNSKLLKSLVLTALATFVSLNVSAGPIIPWDDTFFVPPKKNPKASRLHPRVPAGSACEQILLNASTMLGRDLTKDEIDGKLARIIVFTGEDLLQEETSAPAPATPAPAPSVPARHPRRMSCFTSQMKVRTPTGERAISELRQGDAVISLDLARGVWVTNVINELLVTPQQNFGRIMSAHGPLEVTETERFYVGGNDYQALMDLKDTTLIYQVGLSADGTYKMTPVPRGPYIMDPACSTVYNLNLVGEPRNFIINGVLVHNIKVEL